jgi:peptide/nickel transport system substrate-binding protein
LWWQGPTLLNPHFAVGTKDQDGSRVFYEPLAGWDPDGNLVPVLAAEIPSVENGGLAKDGLSVTWKLKQGVKWHDGQPFTADDCVFNWQYAADPRDRGDDDRQLQGHQGRQGRRPHDRVEFEKPTPFWADAFVGVAA